MPDTMLFCSEGYRFIIQFSVRCVVGVNMAVHCLWPIGRYKNTISRLYMGEFINTLSSLGYDTPLSLLSNPELFRRVLCSSSSFLISLVHLQELTLNQVLPRRLRHRQQRPPLHTFSTILPTCSARIIVGVGSALSHATLKYPSSWVCLPQLLNAP